jgi:hypothetical protein
MYATLEHLVALARLVTFRGCVDEAHDLLDECQCHQKAQSLLHIRRNPQMRQAREGQEQRDGYASVPPSESALGQWTPEMLSAGLVGLTPD